MATKKTGKKGAKQAKSAAKVDSTPAPTCHPSRAGVKAALPKRENRYYGWRPDLPDKRDFKYVRKEGVFSYNLPEEVDLRESGHLPRHVYDQGALGSCTANAIGAAYEYMQRRQGLHDYMPSRLFVYYGEREMEGTIHEDAGAEIRDGIKVIAKLGTPHESLWRYDISKFDRKPAPKAYADGLLHQCITYQRVTQDEVSIKAALAAGHPIVFGFTVYESFESDAVAATGMVPYPGADESVLGGHAVLMIGYIMINGELYAICLNSWGDKWGEKGVFFMPMALVLDRDFADDFWIITSVEGKQAA